jgi:hypothetical protein
MTERACLDIQSRLSVAHDEDRPPLRVDRAHIETCPACSAFAAGLTVLDRRLGRGEVGHAPPPPPVSSLAAQPPLRWWWVAAVATVGVVVGAVMAGLGSLETVQAQELDDRLHAASPAVTEIEADLVVVERGWHPSVPERVYQGSLSYTAPEQLALELIDTTAYPDPGWLPNDLSIALSNGDLVTTAATPCPLDAVPGCQRPPTATSFVDLPPFDPSVATPLELVGPTRSFSWWSGLDVTGRPQLDGRSTVQVETTVAAAHLIETVTRQGAWRELHPTDRVLLWLDEASLLPLRVEVFASDSEERRLWAVRRGYTDDFDRPIFIIDLTPTGAAPRPVVVEPPPGTRSGGFVDAAVSLPSPVLGPGFAPHRSGHRELADGVEVDLASWSDGRSWLVIQATDDWDGSRFFGMASPFARTVDLGGGSVGYLSPDGSVLAVHGDTLDLTVSGAVTEESLIEVASSLAVVGRRVPADWEAASVVGPDGLPPGTLVPVVEGWSVLGNVSGDTTEIVMTGSGSRRISITSEPGSRLPPPAGPDVTEVDLRGVEGRYDAAAGVLAWVEDGRIHRMRSDTVARAELIGIAESLVTR